MVEVVVVNYRTPHDLLAFTRSLYRSKHDCEFTLTIFNVDPTPEDLRVGFSLEEEHYNTVHMHSRTNIGYAGAVNWALKVGGPGFVPPYIAIFNADTRLRDGVLDGCLQALEDNPDWGAVGPRQYDDRNRLTHAGIFGTLDKPQHRGWLAANDGRYQDVKEAVTISGSAYFTRRSLWEEMTECPLYVEAAPEAVGAFLPTPHFYEETYYSYHLQAHGYKVMYLGTEGMIHLHGKATPPGTATKLMKTSQTIFRDACDKHGIRHD